MQPQFITKPAFTVVGLLIHPTPQSPEIPKLWDQFVPRMDEIQHQVAEHATYGLMGNLNAETMVFDYMAGVAVTQITNLPPGMARWDVPANTYAVFEARLDNLGEVFGHIYNVWLPASEYDHAASPYFEYYGPDFNPHDNPLLSVYVPVTAKG